MLPRAAPINTTLNLPDTVTLGLRQRLGDRFTLLAGYEWSNWSRIGTAVVMQPNRRAGHDLAARR